MRQFKSQSITLIKLNPQSNKLQLTTQAKQYLCSLSNPVAVITIAGLYRTGKSFLVNKLVPGTYSSSSGSNQIDNVFKVGSSTQSMTKGLSILATPITIQCQQTGMLIDYLLIDSQGIGSCEQSLKYDMDLLILIFLISSTVVYNSMGAIDEVSLQQLQAVLKLKTCVENTQHQYQKCKYKCSSQPPKLVWVLRDFALQLIDKNGKQISSDQYLQQCLQQSSSTSAQAKKKNEIRKAIKLNLKSHHCFTLVRPTIKQQDLQHLSTYRSHQQKQTKLRTQFLGQLEKLKQHLFSGEDDDIKRINGQSLTGNLFSRVVQQYLQVINCDKLPKINHIWQQICKQNDQQFYEQQIAQLKKQIKAIKLPLPKQELKLKLNQIQNRISINISQRFSDKTQLSHYNGQYYQIVKKLNSQLKNKNIQLRSSSLMSQLQTFVKQNLKYEQIKPHILAQAMKNFIQRLKIKISSESNQDVLEYVLNIINDVYFVVGQKWTKVERQYAQLKNGFEGVSMDKSNAQLSLMNLKREYHQSLKCIAKLQEGQADIDKNYVLVQSKIASYENKITKMQSEAKQDKSIYDKNYKQLQDKFKNKTQQLSNQLKKYKDQNIKLEQQLMITKQKIRQHSLNSKKQIIFQQKIKQSFDKFHEERINLKKQIQSYKKQASNINQKYTQLKNTYEIQCQKVKQIQQDYLKKEQSFLKQFQCLKQTFKQTKASCDKTYETYQSTEQKMKYLAPSSTSMKEKYQTPGKQIRDKQKDMQNQQSMKMLKKYYETQMDKIRQQHKTQTGRLEQQIEGLRKQIQRRQVDKQIYFMQAKQYRQKTIRLEADIINANKKFNQFLNSIEQAKQKQRLLYEQSIKREKDTKNRDSASSLGFDQRSSLSSINLNARKLRNNNQNVKQGMSFGNVFQTK